MEMESEKFFENQKEKRPGLIAGITKKIYDNFRSRSDEPGEFLSLAMKKRLIGESATNPEARKRLEENKNSKYRVNSLSSPLGATEFFLNSDESAMIPDEKKEELMQKIQKAREDIIKAKADRLTDSEVNQVVKIVEETEKWLGSIQ